MDTDDEIVTFATYYDPTLAQIIRARLEDNDVPCFIADENMIGINPLYNNALGGVKLKVFERDVHRCHLILADESFVLESTEAPEELSEPTDGCPYCNSSNVRYGNATQTRFAWWSWVSWLPSFIFGMFVLPFVAKKDWHCFNCGKDFVEPVERR